jgi:hypothetical protein
LFVSCVVCCLRRADHSLRGVLPGFMCVILSDLETSTMRRPRPDFGFCATEKVPKRSDYPDLSLAWCRRRIELWAETDETRWYEYGYLRTTMDERSMSSAVPLCLLQVPHEIIICCNRDGISESKARPSTCVIFVNNSEHRTSWCGTYRDISVCYIDRYTVLKT